MLAVVWHRIKIFYGPTLLNRRVWRLSLPVMLGMSTTTLVMLADTLMVGQLGAPALAAAGMGGVVFWTVLSFLMGASFGIQILTARYFGARDRLRLGQTLFSSILLTLLTGILITLCLWPAAPWIVHVLADGSEFQQQTTDFFLWRLTGLISWFLVFGLRAWFDGLGRTETGFIASILIMVTNILGNWLLIFGNLGLPQMGTNGAALASSLASLPGLLYLTIMLLRPDFRQYWQPAWFERVRINAAVLRQMILIGSPAAIDNLMLNLSFSLFFKLAAEIGTTAVAASNVLIAIFSVAFMPGFGFGVAATTLLGIRIARQQYRIARAGTLRSALFASTLMSVIGLFVFWQAPWVLQLFTDDQNVIQDALQAVLIMSIVQAADGWQMTMAMALRSAGRVMQVLTIYSLSSILFFLPVSWLLGLYLEMGTMGLWAGFALWLLLLALIFDQTFARLNLKLCSQTLTAAD
ncbi:MAG: MATE family efflux transporter [Leptospiraceae bacterium]|nr:MATE family efflux transporter [Leptospiraceae bacterium]